MIIFKEIVKTSLIEVTDTYEGDVSFKLEIAKTEKNNFSANLYKKSIFTLTPNGEENMLSDEIFWIEFSQILTEDNNYSSIDETMEAVKNSLSEYYKT